MNKVYLIGNLTKDPELSETANGTAVCRFSIAVNRSFASADGTKETDFFNITAWRGQAETIAKYTKKGNKVAVVGSIQLRNYEGTDGVKRQAVDIVANEVEFLTPKGGSFEGGEKENFTPNKQKPKLEAYDDDNDSPF
jgi:single-strand DNA-binding protein